MNYFLISNMYPDIDSPGYGSFVKNVEIGLANNGIKSKYSALIIGRPTSFFNKCYKYILFYINIIKHYFKSYDFIYIHYPNHALPCLLLCYLIKKRRIVVNLHGEDLLYPQKGISLFLGKLNDSFLKKVDAIVVPSLYYKDIVKERIHDKKKYIIVSPSGGINANIFYPKPFDYNDKEIFHLGYVGRIDPRKGWREFIEALDMLPDKLNYKATIIGYGSEVECLKEYLSREKRCQIDYIPRVAHGDLRKYYSQFDILLFPSMRKEESLGLVGIEAMACGTPVIGSNIGGIPSYLTHKENGYLVEPGDITQITKYVIEYCQLGKENKEYYYKNCVTTSKCYYSEKVLNDLAKSFIKLFGNDYK